MNPSQPEPGLRARMKGLVRRAFRPAVWDLQLSAERIESSLRELRASAPQPSSYGSIWRGGADGGAFTASGTPDPAATSKYRDELAYWIAALNGNDPSLGARFLETFESWQRTRLNELADRLSLDRGGAMDAWCAVRDVVEIGGGPIPSCAYRRFHTAVAVDPLADGYMNAGLHPRQVKASATVHLPACGESIPLPSGSADLVIAENCLDHTDAPQRVVAEIRRILRPSGLLWLLVDLMDYKDHMHPSPLSPERLDALVLPEGFTYLYRDSWEGASHPMARLQLRALLQRGPAA